jgi:hypothetical protein
MQGNLHAGCAFFRPALDIHQFDKRHHQSELGACLKVRDTALQHIHFSDYKDGAMASTILLSLPFVLLPLFAAFTYFISRHQ